MDKITKFHQKAQKDIDLTTSSVIDEMSDKDLSKLVHELWVRQVELEGQNEELRKALTDLETSQHKYANLYNSAPVGYCLFDRDGLIREANLPFVEQLGVEKSIFLNTRLEHYILEEDREIFAQHLHTLFTTKTRQRCEIRFIHPDGTQVHARLESIIGQEGQEYVNYCKTVIIDISEDKQKEKQLRENEERLRQVIQTLPVMISAFDEHLNVIVWNRECERITGYRAEEIVGNPNARELLYPEPAYRQQILTALIDEGKFGNFRDWEWETTCKNGTVRTIAWSNVSKHYVAPNLYGWAIGVDITERKQTEEELKQSQYELEQLVKDHTMKLDQTTQQLQQEVAERKRFEQAFQASQRQYRLLVENVADGIAIIQEQELTFANNALSTMFGFTGDQLLRIDPVTLIHHDYRAHFQETLDLLVGGDAPQSFQAPCVTRGGREIWIEGEHNIIEWEGKPAILMTVRNITERKLREIAMEQEQKRLQNNLTTLKTTLKERYRFGDLIGKSAVMQEVYEQIVKASVNEANVFVYGESGTGKELIARTIHKMSKRCDQRFVPVNCGAIPETLFESEFFGHRKGAFTGAIRDKQGFFSAAHKGTLFLDELGELPPAIQVKLLRVLDDGEYTPIGETTLKRADVRIIAATNRNIDDMRKRRLIREDFFFRLHVFAITVPPLRERKEDIPLLIDYLLKRYGSSESLSMIPGEMMEILYTYDWPGNVRELQNALQRYLSGQPLQLNAHLKKSSPPQLLVETTGSQRAGEFREVTEDFEKKLILNVLEQHRWNKSKTAATLGIPRRTLYRKMQKYGIV